MSLLSNRDLEPLLNDPVSPIVEGLKLPVRATEHDSPLEACSIRLSIGSVFINKRTEDVGREFYHNAMEEHSSYLLPPGGVAFVVTKEEICLPSDFAGIMTAKSGGVAERGILITNTGQVDPGFRGPLRYAVMNMGAEGFALERGHSITKLMLFKLSSPASPNWNEKVGHSSPATPSRANLASLGEELLNIQRRAEKTARKAVQIELSNWGLRSVALGFIAAVVIAVIERI